MITEEFLISEIDRLEDEIAELQTSTNTLWVDDLEYISFVRKEAKLSGMLKQTRRLLITLRPTESKVDIEIIGGWRYEERNS